MLRQFTARSERWALARPFRISRGVKRAADVVVVEISANGAIGHGEAVPYPRYDESVDSVLAQIAALPQDVTRADLQRVLAPGAARNAVDCALWDLEAKLSGRSVADLAGVAAPAETFTAITISLDAPNAMREAARAVRDAPLIKIKVDAETPVACVEAVREAAPKARLIVDPNESWSPPLLRELLPRMHALDVALLEQPIPALESAALDKLDPPVPICADEALHTRADFARIAGRYQAVNIKLDKTGGFTEALALKREALARGFTIMVGCMVGTSLGVIPALHLCHDAAFVDLDGPWWLAQDRAEAVSFSNGRVTPPVAGWGQPAVSA